MLRLERVVGDGQREAGREQDDRVEERMPIAAIGVNCSRMYGPTVGQPDV